ncbi:GNAT family N-acetyltransferase [Antrihabitans cavernicola]|uniref:GNAT family N-acetyltransferase n=2 Tax=Antrihabitans cavernicola TaxID=2495913 RepID=A0A5A7SG19_9NOCA|nr:GNAT family N-acetyltransferase [Spelaeibacter cavernicola]
MVPDHVLAAFDVDKRAEQWERIRRSGTAKTFVALDHGVVIGFSSSGPTRDPGAPVDRELYALYLRGSFHGSGIATALLDAAIGPDPVALWVFDDNPRAEAFYRKSGFDADGARRLEPFSGVMEVRMIRRQALGTAPDRVRE